MSQIKQLMWWGSGLFGAAIILTVAVAAYDRCDLGIIDHMCHFDVNKEAFVAEADRINSHNKENERIKSEWVRDLQGNYRDNDKNGSNSPPDKD